MGGISKTIVAELYFYIAIENNASRTPNEFVVKKSTPRRNFPRCDWGFLNLDEIQRWSHYLEIRLRGVSKHNQFVMGVFPPANAIGVSREQKTVGSSTLVQCTNDGFETTSAV